MASEIASIASCAASMEKKQLEQEVIKIRTQLLLNQQQQQQIRTAMMNKTLHNGILQNVTEDREHRQ